MQRLEVECPDCYRTFHVAPSMKGGVSNCPHCGRLTQIESGAEPLYWGLVGCGAVIVLAVSAIFFFAAGPVGGGIAFLIGTAILVAVSLAA